MLSIFFYEPFYDLECIVNQALAPRQFKNGDQHVNKAVRSFKPRMDLHEDSEKNQVTAIFELPGVAKENVNIDVHNGRLTVSTETKQSEDVSKDGYAVCERHFGKGQVILLWCRKNAARAAVDDVS